MRIWIFVLTKRSGKRAFFKVIVHKFNPEHMDRLLSTERLMEQHPEGLLRHEGLAPGDSFADVGCGPGFFTVPAAGIVGEIGRVYAIDISEEMLFELDKRDPPTNVVLVKSGEAEIPLADAVADMALVSYVLHEAENAVAFLREVGRILTDGGILLVLDWKKRVEEKGPPIGERLTEEEVLELLEEAGFADAEAVSFTDSHYKVSSVKKD